MEDVPKEILWHILSFANEPSVLPNLRSSCTTLHKTLTSIKTQYIIKALPVNALDALSVRLNKVSKPFELIVRSPPLALHKVPNKFMNTLTSLKNLTGLDLTDWKYHLPLPALLKLLKLKSNLERLTASFHAFDISPLVGLTKLSIPLNSLISPKILTSLTNLRDLQTQHLSPEDLDAITNLPLTKLHFGFPYSRSLQFVTLTTLTRLKDLKIDSANYSTNLHLEASCTTLESLYIGHNIINLDVDWILSNKNLTNFCVRCDDWISTPEKYSPLTNLRKISSMKFFRAVPKFFQHLDLEHLDANVTFAGLDPEDIFRYTSLRSLSLVASVLPNFPTTLVHLTRLMLQHIYPWPQNVLLTAPPQIKEFVFRSACVVQNLQTLTNLESLYLFQPPQFDKYFSVESFGRMTKLELDLNGAQQAVQYLPKLSNLFSLKELTVTAPNNYQGVNAEFLTTLTNLEMLSMAQINIDLAVFNKFVMQRNNLTHLQVNCSESNGEILTRLTNLQILHFYSRQPMKGLKIKLEELLPRLVECQF